MALLNNNNPESLLKTKSPVFDDVSKTNLSLDKPKISKLLMNKYEFNQIIGLRTIQLASGMIPFVNIEYNIKSNMELRKIALEELKQGKLPYIIKRPLPNGFEYVRVKDLDLIQVRDMINL